MIVRDCNGWPRNSFCSILRDTFNHRYDRATFQRIIGNRLEEKILRMCLKIGHVRKICINVVGDLPLACRSIHTLDAYK